jgi:ABC-type multidrug transport system ATPase subunit
MLRVEHIRVGRLPPLSFAVPAGECLSVEGPSGCGKTRLLRALADLDPAEGHVFLDGAERGEMPAWQWRRRVRYVAAEPGWWAPTPRAHMPVAPRPDRLDRLVRALGLLPEILDRPVVELSTGERQRLALIRTIVDEPRVLLLDEPTASLDPEAAALTDEVIRFETLAGRAVVLVSHNPAEVERLAHARLLLAPGAGALAVDSGRC